MKKIVLILLLTIASITIVHSQGLPDPVVTTKVTGNPGFGTEGGGDAQTAPVTPISNNLKLGMVAGLLLAGYFFYKKKKKTA